MSLNSVGILTINDDILTDKKSDFHSKFLIKELNGLQYNVTKVTVIPENKNVIANELNLMVKSCGFVIILCEKCNVLYEVICKITSQKQEQNDALNTILNEIREPHERHHTVLPIHAKILGNNNLYPVIYFQRIFILKEKYAKQCFSKILKPHLCQYKKERSFRKIVRIAQNGNAVSDMNEINKLLQKSLNVKHKRDGQYFVIDVSSPIFTNIVEFERKITDKFECSRVQFSDQSEVWDDVYLSDEGHIKTALEIIEKCIEQYGLKNIFICFNGGKDCTVLLHLVLTTIKKKYAHHTKPLFCLYVQSDRPFPEQDEFIKQMQCFYNLEILTIQSGIKSALQQTLIKYPNLKACFMGTRRTDPHSSDLNAFQLTDANWPQIMRVGPLLDWHYSDIWDYLLFFKVPYCTLYDVGYTSLGNTENTTKNPSLIYYDHFEEKEISLPAYKLFKEEKERNGRNF